jgi:hypothetical protein
MRGKIFGFPPSRVNEAKEEILLLVLRSGLKAVFAQNDKLQGSRFWFIITAE